MPFITRDANEGDLDFIETLSQNAFADRGSYGPIIRNIVQCGLNDTKTYKTVVAERIDDSQQLGFGVIQLKESKVKESYIPAIAVIPVFYRGGIGRRLLKRLVELSQEHGDMKVTLHVDPNSPAHGMFTQFGFAQVPGGFQYPAGVLAISMRLDL